MDGKWTQGPWRNDSGVIRAEAAWYTKVCDMPTWGPYDDPDVSATVEAEVNANAALIASAPRLLEACKEAVDVLDDIDTDLAWLAVIICRNAIEAATGGQDGR